MLERILDNRNPFWQFMGKLFDIVILNFLWILFSIPIFSIPSSTTAVYAACFQLLQGKADEGCPRIFRRSWKSNLLQSLGLGLILLAAAALFSFDLWYFSLAQTYLSGPLKYAVSAFVALILIIVLITGIYAFALQAVFANTVKGTLLNALLLALRHPVRSLGMLVIDTGFLVCGALSLYFLPILSMVLILFGVGLPIFLNCLILLPVLREHMPEDAAYAEEAEPEIYD